MDRLLWRLAAVVLALVLIGVSVNLPAGGLRTGSPLLRRTAPAAHRGIWPAWAHGASVTTSARAEMPSVPHAMQAPSGTQRAAAGAHSALGSAAAADVLPPAWRAHRLAGAEQGPAEAHAAVLVPPPRVA